MNTADSPSSGSSSTIWNTYFLSAIWIIWKSRNALVFQGTKTPPHILYQRACNLVANTRLALASNIIVHAQVPKWIRWHPPDFPFLKLNTDGAMNHSTGNASAGGVIRNHGGRWLYGFAVNIGPQSSYMAELWGCRDGLKLASELGVTHLILEMDSLLAVQTIQARNAGEGSASVLLSNIFHYLDSFVACTVQHTLREGNAATDYMASMGHTYSQGLTLFQSPPPGISCILYGDVIGTSFLRT
ncbi:hypothetical protein SLA2020_123470 [Shorea laevis]